MNKKAIVLLSSGLDSLVNTALAVSEGYNLHAVTFDYGQKAAVREKDRSQKICEHYRITHQIIKLPWMAEVTDTALVNKDVAIPGFEQDKLMDFGYAENTAKQVWVPNRNGVFINIAASIAEAKGIAEIIAGFNAEEAKTFPDNTIEYVAAVNIALGYSTLNEVKVTSFTAYMNKKQIAAKARELSVPLDICWPCYGSGKKLCGKCESCVRYFNAIG